MARLDSPTRSAEDMLREFTIYDRAVDIVSIYHWLFTETNIAETVEHFERYPRIVVDGVPLTPDFTVLFKNGTGWAAEIANIALPDGSIESLCRQLDKYSRLESLPNASGGLTSITDLDVVFLTPMGTGTDAARRIFIERIRDADHWYKPKRDPVMIQVAQNTDNYTLQVWPDRETNGTFSSGGSLNYRDYSELNPKPSGFAPNKVTYAFVNDPVPAIYMATRLWSNVFPSQFGTTGAFEATTRDVARILQDQYGHGRTAEVEAALVLLRTAGLATFSEDVWKVRRRNLGRSSNNVQVAIASLAGDQKGASSPPRRRRQSEAETQLALFDLAPSEDPDSDDLA